MIKIESLKISNIENIVCKDSPSFSGIVTGECKGDLWIDNLNIPSLALAYSFAVDGFSILGEFKDQIEYDKFKIFLESDLFPALKEKGFESFEFSVESEKTEQAILKMFSNKKIESEDEYKYRKITKDDRKIKIPNEYSIHKVDPEFVKQLKQNKYENSKFLTVRLLESWSTYENFLNRSVAFVATYKSEITALIVGTARFQNIISIDIETQKNHRKKGLASILTHFFINSCIENGLIAQWDCVDSNLASKKTAENADFTFLKKRSYYWFEI